MSDLGLDVGQANDLKMAFRRAGWTSADVARLCAGDCAARILPEVRNEAIVSQPPRRWSEKDGVISLYLGLMSHGNTKGLQQIQLSSYEETWAKLVDKTP